MRLAQMIHILTVRHPASIDAVVSLTPDVIATGSEDGMIRVMQILPTKFCTSPSSGVS
jgi:hypothetical protein